MVRTTSAVLAFLCLAGAAAAQTSAPPARAPRPKNARWEMTDNSFLVEEAFNEEPGIFQNIFAFVRQRGGWLMAFTQEWPAPNLRHQLSYTLSATSVASKAGLDDVLLHYRFQALHEGPGRPAFAPRFTAIVPAGSVDTGGGEGGIQINLPVSKQHGDFYLHGNGGFTWLPRGRRADLLSPSLAGSAIYRLRPMVHLVLEAVAEFDAGDSPRGTVERTRSLTISPGVRGGWNVRDDAQVILGLAVPTTVSGGTSSIGVLGYFSYELPFKKK